MAQVIADTKNNKPQTTGAWILAILGAVYTISPIDIIPDIPVIGWVDDFFVLSATILNLLEKTTGRTHHSLRAILKTLKWTAIILGILVILLFLLLGTLLYNWLAG